MSRIEPEMDSTSSDKQQPEKPADPALKDPTTGQGLDAEQMSNASNDRSRLGSIVHETRGLVSDLKDWVDIRVQLLQVDVEERIEAAIGKVISIVAVAVLFLFTALFFLMAAAEALGSWMGHTAWGYLSIGAVLGLATIIVNASRRWGTVKEDDTNTNKTAELQEKSDVPLLPQDSKSAPN